MEFPDNKATRITELIIFKIRECLKTDEKNQPNHYNHVYSRIHEILTENIPKHG